MESQEYTTPSLLRAALSGSARDTAVAGILQVPTSQWADDEKELGGCSTSGCSCPGRTRWARVSSGIEHVVIGDRFYGLYAAHLGFEDTTVLKSARGTTRADVCFAGCECRSRLCQNIVRVRMERKKKEIWHRRRRVGMDSVLLFVISFFVSHTTHSTHTAPRLFFFFIPS